MVKLFKALTSLIRLFKALSGVVALTTKMGHIYIGTFSGVGGGDV